MRIALQLMVLAFAAACSPKPAPKEAPAPEACPPAAAEVTLSATERVNPSQDGEGRPVQVRVYLLESDARLRNATFEEIWQNDKEVLLTDLKSVTEYTVFPGKTQPVSVKRDPEANFLAIVALFREPQGKDWFVSYELEAPRSIPPCESGNPLPIVLDRMQIQDGEGRTDVADAAGSDPTAEEAESDGSTEDGSATAPGTEADEGGR